MKEFLLTVAPDESGMRLDAFVAAHVSSCSRSYASALVRDGNILVDGTLRKPAYKVHQSETVTGSMPPPLPSSLLPEPIDLNILFEDEYLIVLNKPAGLVVHPAAGHYHGTLVHGLLHHCPDLEGTGGVQRPGIVHRLDKDTSGIMLVAKNGIAHQELSRQFKEREIAKTYMALVHGVPSSRSGRIEAPIGRHRVDRKKMSTNSPIGRKATTVWNIKEQYGNAALLEISLETGRTHQIRVHCQTMGHAVVGDPIYGPTRSVQKLLQLNKGLHDILAQAQRQMLHAFRLSFVHPHSGRILSCEAPLPVDMISILDQLKKFNAKEARKEV